LQRFTAADDIRYVCNFIPDNDDHFCEPFDINDSSESNSASNQVRDAPTIPPSDAPTNAPKLSPKELKKLIKSCLLKFKFFGYRTNNKCCQIAESSDEINYPIGAVISEINGETIHHYNSNQLHYVLSRCSSSTIFKVHIYINMYIYVYLYIYILFYFLCRIVVICIYICLIVYMYH
jgi:hypothetical protein